MTSSEQLSLSGQQFPQKMWKLDLIMSKHQVSPGPACRGETPLSSQHSVNVPARGQGVQREGGGREEGRTEKGRREEERREEGVEGNSSP